ncbi:MAG TPA: GrdX protein [Synergistaceae bacterium]|jgi:hypothetical protein|nr:GrdX protein [Synergistaceae bacterium]
MVCRRLLVTNNPQLCPVVRSCVFVEGTTLDVLLRVRDHVHLGWRLLTHPLYGNLRPHQHLYRSILLERQEGSVDLESLDYMESALRIYTAESRRIMSADGIPEEHREDFAFVDYELIKESLLQYGMVTADGALPSGGRR